MQQVNERELVLLGYGSNRIFFKKREPYAFYGTFVAGYYKSLRLRPGDIVLDAGSNVGDFAIFAAKHVLPNGSVIAVEPNPGNLAILRRNIELNRLDNILIVPYALSDAKRELYLSADSQGGELTDVDTSGIKVNTVTLHDVLGELDIKSFDVIKMDIEGSESEVFSDPFFLQSARELCIELHGEKNISQITEILKSEGFHIVDFSLKDEIINTMESTFLHLPSLANAEIKTRFVMSKGLFRFLLGRNSLGSIGRESGLRVIYAYKPLWHV